MNLKDIAAVSGKSGLFKIVKPTRTGVILETIDQNKSKVIANTNDRVSLLREISIYTSGAEASIPLEQVFSTIYQTYAQGVKVDSKSSPQDLTAFIAEVVPDYDREKVYMSDVKKLAVWYNTLVAYYPERFTEAKEDIEQPSAVVSENEEQIESVTEETKPKARKSPAKK